MPHSPPAKTTLLCARERCKPYTLAQAKFFNDGMYAVNGGLLVFRRTVYNASNRE